MTTPAIETTADAERQPLKHNVTYINHQLLLQWDQWE